MRELIYSDESTLPRKIKKKTVELQMRKNEKTNRRK